LDRLYNDRCLLSLKINFASGFTRKLVVFVKPGSKIAHPLALFLYVQIIRNGQVWVRKPLVIRQGYIHPVHLQILRPWAELSVPGSFTSLRYEEIVPCVCLVVKMSVWAMVLIPMLKRWAADHGALESEINTALDVVARNMFSFVVFCDDSMA
jgi:hypothetical protein